MLQRKGRDIKDREEKTENEDRKGRDERGRNRAVLGVTLLPQKPPLL